MIKSNSGKELRERDVYKNNLLVYLVSISPMSNIYKKAGQGGDFSRDASTGAINISKNIIYTFYI